MHCSDTVLLALFDGELPSNRRWETIRHLESCWRCRSRLNELESALAHLNRAVLDADSAVGNSLDRIQRRLFNRIEECGLRHEKVRKKRSFIFLFFAGAGAVVAAGKLTLFSSPPFVAPVPVETQPVVVIHRVNPTAATPPPLPVLPERLARIPYTFQLSNPVNLDSLEIELRYKMHQTGADLSDGAIRVNRKDGKLAITGVVESAQQRWDLSLLISQLSRPDCVNLEVLIPAEVHVTAGPATLVDNRQSAELPAELPFEQALLKLAGSQERLSNAGNEAVSLVEKMTDIAWQLRILDSRFPTASRSNLQVESRRLLQIMEEDYIVSLGKLAVKLRTCLSFMPLKLGGLPLAGEAQASRAADQVFALRSLLEWLFAGRVITPCPSSLDEIMNNLSASLSNLVVEPTAPDTLAELHQFENSSRR